MIKSIVLKEWLKLKYYSVILGVLLVAILGHFAFNLDFLFSTIEPESMMWYRFIHLEDKPYFYLSYFYLVFGVVIALVQFLPERIKNRIKIMAHLPMDLKQSLFIHLSVGAGFVVLLSVITSLGILTVLNIYYPDLIVLIGLKDVVVFTFLSVLTYLGLSAVIIEKNYSLMGIKLLIVALVIVVLLKESYTFQDMIWVLLLLFFPFIALDSFYSVKEQRLESLAYKISSIVLVFGLSLQSYIYYKENYQKEFNKFYIFYSNVAKDFVYQKNYGGHKFEYGIKDKKTFDKAEYESYLPFVYWRNLDIQKKLPIVIDGKEFDKKTIKDSRLGFSYKPSMLKPLELGFYPLLNPQSDKGMIVFPEEMFAITSLGATVYAYDNITHTDHKHEIINKRVVTLGTEMNQQLQKNGFKYPAKNIWGKATNMKPYDKGYLILDQNNQLFNLYMVDDVIYVKQVNYPEGIDIAFIKISENRQRKLSGYAIDKESNFYLLNWDFKFIKLDLENFDYKTMKLKLISNPLNYLIRYDNGTDYYGTLFLKNTDMDLQKVKDVQIK